MTTINKRGATQNSTADPGPVGVTWSRPLPPNLLKPQPDLLASAKPVVVTAPPGQYRLVITADGYELQPLGYWFRSSEGLRRARMAIQDAEQLREASR